MEGRLGFPDIAKRYPLLMLVMAAILYGSLYPFEFALYGSGQAGLVHLLGTWRDPPTSRGDLVANILLYTPLGFAAGYSSGGKLWHAMIKALAIGASLSFSIEWLQFYDQSRVSCLSDFYLNVTGSVAGVLVSQWRAFRLPVFTLPDGRNAQFARVLLLAWVAWRLYPYVPTIDLHKYWDSLKPLVLHPEIDAYDVFRFAVLWMGVSHLLRSGVLPKMRPYLLPAVIAAYFCGKVMVIDQELDPSEIMGAAIALPFSVMPQRHFQTVILALLVAATVVLSRVLPWQLTGTIRSFQWMPFYGLLHGSLEVDTLSLCEKVFLYGTLLLLLVEAGLPLVIACGAECIALLATSAMETMLSGRSAEITDAAIALLLAVLYMILGWQSMQADDAAPARTGANSIRRNSVP